MVAQGHTQQHGVDYNEVFAPVVKMTSIRSILAISNELDLEVHQMDVRSAYLNGIHTEEIYMKQPEGFINEKYPHRVCRLKKSLYGLKQSARCWHEALTEYLKDTGYVQSTADGCIYYFKKINNFLIMAVYVDDTVLALSLIHISEPTRPY